MTTPGDPFALFRDWVTQWEQLVNTHGADLLAKPEVARAVQGATSAGLQLQGSVHEAMAKVLASANLPSKSDIEALGRRLAAIEEALARIEAGQTGSATPASRPAPRRTRKPA